jgi:phosphatidylcholine synthase
MVLRHQCGDPRRLEYWNLVVFYLYVMRTSEAFNAAVLVALAVLVFVPIRYIYPSRTPRWQPLTLVLGAIWGVLMLVMLWQFPAVSRGVFIASLAFPVYYTALSVALTFRRGAR